MFRILLADDEGIMLESLKGIIASSFGSECEIHCVKTGRAVVEEAESFHPDIAFVDIHMPGLSGIQAIQEIRKVNREMIVIIITAYDKFSYAKEAVNLGVMEYLTKPIASKKVILDVCMRAMQRVEEARQKRSADLEIREKLEIVVPMLESGFIYSMIQDDSGSVRSGYEKLLGLDKDYGFYMVLEFGDRSGGVMTNAIGVGVKVNHSYAEVRELIRDFFTGMTGPVMGNRIVLFVPTADRKLKYQERVEVITRAVNMVHRLEERVHSDFRCGIGRVKAMENGKESYQEALRALRESDSHVAHIMDIPGNREEENEEYPVKMEKLFFERGMNGDSEGAAACADEIFRWLLENQKGSRPDMEIKVLELVIELEHEIERKDGGRRGFQRKGSYLRELQEAADEEGIRRFLLEKTREACKSAGFAKKKESEYLVDKVKRYIDENYQKDISLDDISMMVNISPYYFSRLFKQGTGETFIEYLAHTRMRQARVYLQDPDLSIKQICAMVGYGDPNYFSRIFKKYEGINPSEYREEYLKEH